MRIDIRLGLALVLAACTTSPSSVATGELGPWQTAAPLPTPRANHCSTAVGDWILVIGGNYMTPDGFVKTDEIHAARLAADGTLGAWQLAGHTPSPVTECSATSDGKTLYLVDGIYDRDTDGGQVWTAAFHDGTLAPLTTMGTLPTRAISSESTLRDGTLITMTTQVPKDDDGGKTTAIRTDVDALAWSSSDLGIGFHAQSEFAFSADNIYSLGGYHDPAVGSLADVYVSPIAGGPARMTTPLPQPVGFGEAVVVDDWLFVVGGRAQVFGAGGTTNVYAAQVAGDGSVGAWTPSALPLARTNHDLALVGDYFVLTGGAVSGPGDATVLVSQVRFAE